MSETGTHHARISGASIHRSYDTAVTFSSLTAFFGWALVVIGVFGVWNGLFGSGFNMLIAGSGLGIAAFGLLQVVVAQMARAIVDTANYSRQSLLLQIALAQGRTEIDLRAPSPEQGVSDISRGLSEAAIAGLRKAEDQGYEVTFSPDKSSVTVSKGGSQNLVFV